MSEEDMKSINLSLTNTMSYFLLKYPQSESSEINQKLNKIISHTNTLKSNENNLLIKSQVKFQYRQGGNYNDLIMKFINYIIETVDEEDEEGSTTFMKFE